MTRPFELHASPPIEIEIKYGITRKKGNYNIPKSLDHFRIVSRIKNDANFELYAPAHDALALEQPKAIPITLLSDDPLENFPLFRGLFGKTGQLACGASYGSDVATRRFKGKEIAEPFEHSCNADCKFWKEENKNKPQCKLGGILYFRLNIPGCPGKLGALRVNGTYGQRRIVASLAMIASQTGGIMTNLPLVVSIHHEKKKAIDGKTYPIPMLSISPAGTQNEFFDALQFELERRRYMQDLNEPNKPLHPITGALEGIRSAVEEEVVLEDAVEMDDAGDITDDVRKTFEVEKNDDLIEF